MTAQALFTIIRQRLQNDEVDQHSSLFVESMSGEGNRIEALTLEMIIFPWGNGFSPGEKLSRTLF
jgi:hypothetical protein